MKLDDSNFSVAPAHCGDPGQIPHATRGGTMYGPFTDGTSVVFHCHSGYSGGGAIICLSNGQWSSKPYCIRMNYCFFYCIEIV